MDSKKEREKQNESASSAVNVTVIQPAKERELINFLTLHSVVPDCLRIFF